MKTKDSKHEAIENKNRAENCPATHACAHNAVRIELPGSTCYFPRNFPHSLKRLEEHRTKELLCIMTGIFLF